jgi:hypothetical protein
MLLYYGFPSKLHHGGPHWVQTGALFQHLNRHRPRKRAKAINCRSARASLVKFGPILRGQTALAHHAVSADARPSPSLLSFASDQSMSKIVGHWKHFQSRKHGIVWQEGYFDHRLRDDERGEQLSAKMNYIRHSPVAAGLCTRAEDWPWIIERSP